MYLEQISVGLQKDGTFIPLIQNDISELSQQSIAVLIDMGYPFDRVVQVLRTLKLDKKYNPIGEVQKAIDWIEADEIRIE